MPLKTIVWDVDDVLGPLMSEWFHSWKENHPECGLIYEDLTENPPHDLLGIELEEYLSSLDEYRLSGAYQMMEPRPEILDWFKEHGTGFRHMALTQTPLGCAHISSDWVLRYFGNWIRMFAFVPTRRPGDGAHVYDNDKASFLKWLTKADILVEDSPQNAEDAKALGIHSILLAQPWNNGLGIKECMSEIMEENK